MLDGDAVAVYGGGYAELLEDGRLVADALQFEVVEHGLVLHVVFAQVADAEDRPLLDIWVSRLRAQIHKRHLNTILICSILTTRFGVLFCFGFTSEQHQSTVFAGKSSVPINVRRVRLHTFKTAHWCFD